MGAVKMYIHRLFCRIATLPVHGAMADKQAECHPISVPPVALAVAIEASHEEGDVVLFDSSLYNDLSVDSLLEDEDNSDAKTMDDWIRYLTERATVTIEDGLPNAEERSINHSKKLEDIINSKV